jgi:drug/metabolite transporter (DMT)-like permease
VKYAPEDPIKTGQQQAPAKIQSKSKIQSITMFLKTLLSPQNREVVLSIIAYSFCSGTLVLINKLILHQLPYPSLVICFQIVAALVFIYTAQYLHMIQVDALEWKFVKPYLYYIIGFCLGVFCNMKSLSVANVETVIVFRALVPCIVAFCDALFLGREYPGLQSWLALSLIVLGAYGYASHDEKFQSQGVLTAYFWPCCYCLTISFEMIYGKSILKSVDLKTQSGPVLYTNLLSLAPMLLFASMNHEYEKFAQNHLYLGGGGADEQQQQQPITLLAVFLLLLGSIAGTGIGYSSWWCRGKVSATSFSLIGVINKCLTIMLNLVVWDQHANSAGIANLFICLVGGALYRQAPMRSSSDKMNKATTVANQADDVWKADMDDPMTTDGGDDEVEILLIGSSTDIEEKSFQERKRRE